LWAVLNSVRFWNHEANTISKIKQSQFVQSNANILHQDALPRHNFTENCSMFLSNHIGLHFFSLCHKSL
jgi:hypothetical protein